MKNLYDLRVAHILDEHRVVLNAGYLDGVEPGMSFVVYMDGPEITDPVNGNSLGTLEVVKGRVWVHQVAEQHSVAGDHPEEAKTRPNYGTRLSAAFGGNLALLDVLVNDKAKRVS